MAANSKKTMYNPDRRRYAVTRLAGNIVEINHHAYSPPAEPAFRASWPASQAPGTGRGPPGGELPPREAQQSGPSARKQSAGRGPSPGRGRLLVRPFVAIIEAKPGRLPTSIQAAFLPSGGRAACRQPLSCRIKQTDVLQHRL